MKNIAQLALILVFTVNSLVAQDTTQSPVLITLAGKGITVSEFESIYRKNNSPESADPKSLDEYLQLFVNFKLKVKEAEELGYDTTAAFKTELSGYRKQLAQPYLLDKELNDNLVVEAYDRLKFDIKAKHILVKVAADASPKDTLAAYNKIIEYRKRLAKLETFDGLMKEIKTLNSQDILAEDLGYFTAFKMVYPFESAAYNTAPGTISNVVRTRFGYHLVQVLDKRPARGQIKVAHIMVQTKEDATPEQLAQAKAKIDEIAAKANAGENFGQLAKNYSDDKATSGKGGMLPWFGIDKYPMEFEDAAFNLSKDEEISAPVKTKYGYHLIKRLEYKGLEPFDQMKSEIKNRVARDGRSSMTRESLIKKLRAEYGVTPDTKAISEFYPLINNTYFEGEWKPETAAKLVKPLFMINDKKYSKKMLKFTQKDFTDYLVQNMRKQTPVPVSKQFVDRLLDKYIEEQIIKFEEEILDAKYSEFRLLMQEYRDGILLFELMDKKVWSKAVSDTVGLRSFHDNNKTKYLWPDRADATVYTCANAAIAKTVRDMLKKKAKKGYTDESIKAAVNKDSQLNLKIETGLFLKGDNEVVDQVEWKPSTSGDLNINGQVIFVTINKILPSAPKSLAESRGLVTADYQSFLETEWIKELQQKYEVHIDRKALSQIKQQ